jgi:hypothetical protein
MKKRKRKTSLGAIGARRCPKEGTPVRFNPNPVSMMLYSNPPERGMTGRVTAVNLGRGRATCMKGPGGGLVYVRWSNGVVWGSSPYDLDRV